MLLDFFSAQSAPYGDFANEITAQTWQTTGDLTVAGSTWYTEIQSGGDYLCNMWAQIGIAAIFNQCVASLGVTDAAIQAPSGNAAQYRLILPSGPAASGQSSALIDAGLLGGSVGTTGGDTDAAANTGDVLLLAGGTVAITQTLHGASGWFVMSGDGSQTVAKDADGISEAFIPENNKHMRKWNTNLNRGTATTSNRQLVEGMNHQDVAPYYCNYVACALLRSYQTKFGQNDYTTIYRENFVVYHELYVPQSKRLDAALGRHCNPQVLKARAMRSQVLYLQIPNFWCTSYLKAYPQGSCQLTKQKVTILTESVYGVIVNGTGSASTFNQSGKSFSSLQVDSGGIAVVDTTVLFHTISEDTPSVSAANSLIGFDLTIVNTAPTARNTLINPSHYSMNLLCEWAVLPDDERDAMLSVEDTMLITQFGHEQMSNVTSSTAVTYEMSVLHPVAAFHVLGRRRSALVQNKVCDYGGLGNPLTATNDAQEGLVRIPWIKSMTMTFNNKARFPARGPEYYLQLENALHAEQIPDYEHGLEVYSMHFCLGNPFAPQASGSCNPARIEFKKIIFTPHPSLFVDNSAFNGLNSLTCLAGNPDYVEPFVCDIHYNVALIQKNMIGVVYS